MIVPSKWFLVCWFILTAPLGLRQATASELSNFIEAFGRLRIGMAEKELREMYPSALPVDLRTQTNFVVYKTKGPLPLFDWVVFRVQDGKLIGAAAGTEPLSSGWEPADAVMRWGKEAVQKTMADWGRPDRAVVLRMDYGLDSATLQWHRKDSTLHVTFTPPKTIFENTPTERNPFAQFDMAITEPGWQSAYDFDSSDVPFEPFDPRILQADYREFRKRLEVVPAPESARLMPKLLAEVFIGMEVSELRKARTGVRPDDFFNERVDFLEETNDSAFCHVHYGARMDRIVAITVSACRNVSHGDIARLCDSAWGSPDKMLIQQTVGYVPQDFSARVFLWHRQEATTALRIFGGNQSAPQLVVFEKSLTPETVLKGVGKDPKQILTNPETCKRAWNDLLR